MTSNRTPIARSGCAPTRGAIPLARVPRQIDRSGRLGERRTSKVDIKFPGASRVERAPHKARAARLSPEHAGLGLEDPAGLDFTRRVPPLAAHRRPTAASAEPAITRTRVLPRCRQPSRTVSACSGSAHTGQL
jgi:hypothetical protein